MKRENKKLLGIAAVGLSAWLLVAALMQFDNSTQAMLRNDPVPTQDHSVVSSSSDQPRTHGATADETTTSSNQPMTASDPQVMSATTMHTPATNLAHDGPHHEAKKPMP